MNIFIKKNDKVDTKMLRYAAHYFSHKLMNKRMLDNITLRISWTGNETTDDGLCYYTEDDKTPRNFKIMLNENMGRRALLMTLAHEITHLKQYALKELHDSSSGTRWKRVIVNEKEIHYYDTPWEIEAFGRELGLYNRLKENLEHNKNMIFDYKEFKYQEKNLNKS